MNDIYEPREDSILLEKYVKQYAKGFVLDIGTSSGIQALAASKSKKVKEVLATDIQDITGTYDDNFVAVWHLNETTGGAGAIEDATTNNNDGTDGNGVILGAAGKIDGAYEYDGTDDEVDIPTSTSLDALDSMTAEAWVKTDDSSTQNQVIISFYYSDTDRAYIWLDDPANGIRIYNDINNGGAYESNIGKLKGGKMVASL